MENRPERSRFEDMEDDQFDQQQDNLHPQQTFEDQHEQKAYQELENIIMQQVLKIEKKQNNISEQLEQKLSALTSRVPGRNEEEALNIRMHQLAISKILVFTHGKSEFRLVQAHYHIGQAYLNYKCYEQAIDHLTVALKKNTKLNQIKETKLYHSYMLTTLSRCYYQISSYQDALQVLNRAYDIQQGCLNNQSMINNVETLQLISNCHLKLKNYKHSIEYIEKAIAIISKLKGENSKDFAMAKVQLSKIHATEGNLQNAIDELSKSIELLTDINYARKQDIGELYQHLSQYYEKFGDIQKQFQALKQKYNIFEQLYGHSDKKCLKIKRNIAMTMLKHERYAQSLNELQQILEIEQKVYGQNSTQVGRTLKIIGTIHINNNDSNEAQHYLRKAQKILHQQGHAKLVKDIKNKLTYVKQQRQNNRVNLLDINKV